MEKYTKISETELEVTKQIEAVPTLSSKYELDFLHQQEVDILKSKNDFIQARDLELVEVRLLIAKAKELGVRSKIEVELEKETLLEETLTVEPVIKK